MKALIFKEFKLAAHPTCFIFLAFGAMLLIPNYPYYVAFFYTTLSLFFYFLNGRENRDILFTALLPVSKADMVKARCTVCAIFELLAVIIAVPFSFLNRALYGPCPLADCNVAFFGLTFVMFAIFNGLFIPRFYKTAYKLNFLVPCIVVFLFIGAAIALVFFPGIGDYLDATSPEGMVAQLPVLIGGLVIFIVGMVLTCRRSVRNFEKVDL